MAGETKQPVTIELPYPELETFIEKFASNVTRGGVFLPTREPSPKDSVISFEVLLADGKVALKGEGKVVWVKEPEAAAPDKLCGMGIKFIGVDRATSGVLKRIAEFNKARGFASSNALDPAAEDRPELASDGESDDGRWSRSSAGEAQAAEPERGGASALPRPARAAVVSEAMMASEATPGDWPAWMAGWAIDVKGALDREIAGRAVVTSDVEQELYELMPPGFDLSEALRRFVGGEVVERMDEPPTMFVPRVSPPAPTPAPSSPPETMEMHAAPISEPGIDPVATILAERVEAHYDGAPDADSVINDLQLPSESFPAPIETRRGDDGLANLYDLAREEGGGESMIDPEELPDLIDELMVNEEPALPLEPADPGLLTDYELESSAAPPQPTEEVEPRAAPAAASPSPDVDILVETANSSDFNEFDDYDLIDEDGDEAPPNGDRRHRSSAVPSPAQGEGAAAPAAGAYTEADSALNEIFGIARPSDAPPETLDSRHPPFEDLPPLDEADESVNEATVVQQGPFSWDRIGHGGGAPGAQRKLEAGLAPQANAPAIQPAFAPPPEPDDWFAAGAANQPSGARPGDATAPAQPETGRPSAPMPDEPDGQGRKRRSSFFRKLFGGGDEQK